MRFKGAGILILELTSDPAVFLFAGRRRGRVLFEELGGTIDSGEYTNAAAAREAREESCNTLVFDHRSLNNSARVDLGKYRCFIGGLPSHIPLEHVYTKNRMTLHNRHGVDKHYKETFGIMKVPLRDVLLSGIHSWYPTQRPFEVVNNHNERIQLFNRTSSVLKRFLTRNTSLHPTQFRLENITEEAVGPLRGTTSFHVTAN